MTPDDMEGRLLHYLSERVKMRQMDGDIIHGMNVNDPREAVLSVSDLRALLLDYQERGRALEAASPAVPVSREDVEIVSEWLEIAKETPKPLHSSLNYVPVCASEIEAIERILAALGTKPADTGREG